MAMQQIEMVSLEYLVPATHNYRKFMKIWEFKNVGKYLKPLQKGNPA